MKKFFLIPTFLFLFTQAIFASSAHAADLRISPASGSFSVGDTVQVSIYVSSPDQAMNAASGIVSFPSDKLQVTSLSKGDSVMSLWVQEPSFSNSAGTVNFEGVVLNPGFQGASGKIITISFKVKAPGTASVNFSNGAVLANDGAGTSLLDKLNGAVFYLSGSAPKIAPPPETPAKTPAKTGQFYFNIVEVSRKDITEPQAVFIFDAKDALAEIDYYEVSIDNSKSTKWRDNGTHRYQTQVLMPGKHTIFARLVDKAGNVLENSVEFVIGALDAPKITSYPRQMKKDGTLVVEGTTYPNSQVTVWLQEGNKETSNVTVQSDSSGGFVFVNKIPLINARYNLWAQVEDARGAHSNPSEKVSILVAEGFFSALIEFLISNLILIIIAIVVIFILISEYIMHRRLVAFETTIHKQVAILQATRTKRRLTKEEEKILTLDENTK